MDHLKYKTLILLIHIVIINLPAFAQSLTGTTGYYNIPSANLYEDKTFIFGANYLNKNYLEWSRYDHNGLAVYTTFNFLPWAEISLRFTRLLDRTEDTRSVGDRMASARFRPLEETKYFPSVVIGFQSFFTTLSSGSANSFNSSYIVLSKNLITDFIFERISISMGYGSDILPASNYQFIGIFYGVSFTPKYADFLELFIENDASKWNFGSRLTVKNRIVILFGYEGFKHFSGGIAYKFTLP
jgi:hypothetical protein